VKNDESLFLFAESKKVQKLKRVFLNLLTVDAIDLLTPEAFDRYKKVYLGQFIYALNSLETKAYLYGKYFHLGSSLFDVVDLLKEITYEDVLNELSTVHTKYIAVLIHKKA